MCVSLIFKIKAPNFEDITVDLVALITAYIDTSVTHNFYFENVLNFQNKISTSKQELVNRL